MRKKIFVCLFLFFLVFLDPFLINIPIGPLHVTFLRIVLVLFGLYLFIKYVLLFNPLQIQPIKPALVFLIGWFLYGAISILWATNKVEGIKELYYFGVFILLVFSIVETLDRKDLLKWINYSFILIGIVTIVLSLLELAFDFHLSTSRYVIEADTYGGLGLRVATAFFYNENDLSLFLVMITPFFLIQFRKYGIQLFILGLIFFIMFMNGSRIAILAFLFQILIFLFMLYRTHLVNFLKFLLIFTPLFIGVVLYFSGDIVDKIIEITGIAAHGSTSARINLILTGINSILDSFLFGVGAGNFQFHVNGLYDTNGIVNPHNWWLEVSTNYGVDVFVFYLAFLIFLFRKLWQIYKQNNEASLLAFCLLLSYVGFVIACIGPSRLFYFWPMWLLYGATLAFINATNQKEGHVKDFTQHSKIKPRKIDLIKE
ncbi:O-antigen ligase family protein [Bacillus sp. REN16]|uniref:O-antigen ligase family protein n=1 Tax=Bacillus sp. REN16 TaxID=2887296 RepID=UPI001E58D527|nr:O-antigen ligase family protein [Bacillus sp. REN16]MCC3356920.1 O-antigen ligase family protein [Bacillus sp. REN16]